MSHLCNLRILKRSKNKVVHFSRWSNYIYNIYCGSSNSNKKDSHTLIDTPNILPRYEIKLNLTTRILVTIYTG